MFFGLDLKFSHISLDPIFTWSRPWLDFGLSCVWNWQWQSSLQPYCPGYLSHRYLIPWAAFNRWSSLLGNDRRRNMQRFIFAFVFFSSDSWLDCRMPVVVECIKFCCFFEQSFKSVIILHEQQITKGFCFSFIVHGFVEFNFKRFFHVENHD